MMHDKFLGFLEFNFCKLTFWQRKKQNALQQENQKAASIAAS